MSNPHLTVHRLANIVIHVRQFRFSRSEIPTSLDCGPRVRARNEFKATGFGELYESDLIRALSLVNDLVTSLCRQALVCDTHHCHELN